MNRMNRKNRMNRMNRKNGIDLDVDVDGKAERQFY